MAVAIFDYPGLDPAFIIHKQTDFSSLLYTGFMKQKKSSILMQHNQTFFQILHSVHGKECMNVSYPSFHYFELDISSIRTVWRKCKFLAKFLQKWSGSFIIFLSLYIVLYLILEDLSMPWAIDIFIYFSTMSILNIPIKNGKITKTQLNKTEMIWRWRPLIGCCRQ